MDVHQAHHLGRRHRSRRYRQPFLWLVGGKCPGLLSERSMDCPLGQHLLLDHRGSGLSRDQPTQRSCRELEHRSTEVRHQLFRSFLLSEVPRFPILSGVGRSSALVDPLPSRRQCEWAHLVEGLDLRWFVQFQRRTHAARNGGLTVGLSAG